MSAADADARPSLLHLVEPGEVRRTEAHERLARRFRVLIFEADEREGLTLALEQSRFDTFNLLATGRACGPALALVRELGARVLALALESPDAPPDATLTTPTLVLVGTRDETGTAAAAGACVARIPGAHLMFVYDAGRAIGRDRPEAFADVVADFFERHEAFVISRATTVIHPYRRGRGEPS